MKTHIQYAIGLISLGAALVAYAHANFASKSTVERMDERIYAIAVKVGAIEKGE